MKMLNLFSIIALIPLLTIFAGPTLDHHFGERDANHNHTHTALAQPRHTHGFEHSHSHAPRDSDEQQEFAASISMPGAGITQASTDSSAYTTQLNASLDQSSAFGEGNYTINSAIVESSHISDYLSCPSKNPPRFNA